MAFDLQHRRRIAGNRCSCGAMIERHDRAVRLDGFGRVRRAAETDGHKHYLCGRCGNHRVNKASGGGVWKRKGVLRAALV